MKMNKIMIKVREKLFSKSGAIGKTLFCVVFFLMLSLEMYAPPPPPPVPQIPIDGGIGFLIAAGIAYGAKKSFDFSKKKEE